MADRRRFPTFRSGKMILPGILTLLLALFLYSFLGGAKTRTLNGGRFSLSPSQAVASDGKADRRGDTVKLSLDDHIYRLSQQPDVRLFLDQIVEVDRDVPVNYPR